MRLISRLPAESAGQAGFTLLEALVAIALLAGTLVAIFTLVGSVLSSAQRVGRSNDRNQITINALEAMRAINPMLEKAGQIVLGPYSVTWKSTAVSPVTEGAGYPMGTSLYQVALYESAIQVKGGDGVVLAEFKLRQVGYQRVRDTESLMGATPLLGGPSKIGK